MEMRDVARLFPLSSRFLYDLDGVASRFSAVSLMYRYIARVVERERGRRLVNTRTSLSPSAHPIPAYNVRYNTN